MSLNQLLSKALHTRVSIVSSKGTFVRDQDFSRVYLNSTNFICEGKDIGDGMFVYRQRLKARANARNNTKHCWGQQCCLLLCDVSRCNKSQHVGSLDENTKEHGTQIPTIPYIPLFGTRAPAQHCWMCNLDARALLFRA